MMIIYFDCDETLRINKQKDYISRLDSSINIIKEDTVQRDDDGAQFTLKPGVKEMLLYLSSLNNIKLAIASDNKPKQVYEALILLGINHYFSTELNCIELRKGPCPKPELIHTISSSKTQIILIDDKDYQDQCDFYGYTYINYGPGKNATNIIKEINRVYLGSEIL